MFPLMARILRQSRITINTIFLLIFVQLFLVSTWELKEAGLAITLYFVACLTFHAVRLLFLLFKSVLIFFAVFTFKIQKKKQ